MVNGRSANIGPKLRLRLIGTCSESSKVQVKPPADVPVGNVVVSPSNRPYSTSLEFWKRAPVAPSFASEKDRAQCPTCAQCLAWALCAGASCNQEDPYSQNRETRGR